MSNARKKIIKKSKKPAPRSGMIANVKVVGIGGGGGNAVERMSRNFIRGVDFIAINTDHQDLDHCDVREKIYIGRNLTRGLGTGMNPDLGRQAAEENRSEIAEALKGADLIFIAAGLGGGTGTGAAPVVAEVAEQSGALTVAVVTKPFAFEGSQRERIAQEGLLKLKDKVDALIVVPNDRIFTVISKDTPISKAFEVIDDVLRNSLRGIVEIISTPGVINVDFADLRSIMQDAGSAVVGVGLGSGQERSLNAVNAAVNSPLLEMSAEGAKAILLGIAGGKDLKMTEINDAAKLVAQMADPGARIIFGAYHDKALKQNSIKVTLIATRFNGAAKNSLFSNGHEARQGTAFVGMAPDLRGQREIKPPVSGPNTGQAPAKDDVRLAEAKMMPKVQEEQKSQSQKSNEDVWDIPAFLRRRKK